VHWFEKLAETEVADSAQVVDTKRNVALGVSPRSIDADDRSVCAGSVPRTTQANTRLSAGSLNRTLSHK
jgi:hypothetical protein